MGRPGRPRKAEHERLVQVRTHVDADVAAVLQRIADRRGLTLPEVLRRVITGRVRQAEGISPQKNTGQADLGYGEFIQTHG